MASNLVESLTRWNTATEPKRQFRARAGIGWVVRKQRFADHLHRSDESAAQDEAVVADHIAALRNKSDGKWHRAPVADRIGEVVMPRQPKAMAVCKLTRYIGDEAECEVQLAGYELPSVSFPAWTLRARGLKEGDRFLGTLGQHNRIRPRDIDTDVSKAEPRMPAEQLAELERLYAESDRYESEGEQWTADTGPGK
jgi:hypothetical protein